MGISENEARRLYNALIEEMMTALAHLEDIRFPLLGKLVPRLGLRSGGRKQPQQPLCAICNDGTRASPRHVVSVHGLTYADYAAEHGGMIYVEGDGTKQVYVAFKLFKGAREELMSRGPLLEIMEDDHGSIDREHPDVGEG